VDLSVVVLLASQLLQELDHHPSYINTLCFNQDGSLLYSADSTGNIQVWTVCLEDGASFSGITVFCHISLADIAFELSQLLIE